MLIYFEGVDKTGKTTLAQTVLKATNYKHVVFDRGPISQVVYDKAFNRVPDPLLPNAFKFLQLCKPVVFLCEAPTELIEVRLERAQESLPDELKDIDKVKGFFRDALNASGLHYVVLDTSRAFDDVLRSIERVVPDVKGEWS